MNSNTPNRWDDPVKVKPKLGMDTAVSVGGWFLALPKGAKIGILLALILLFTVGFGTVLGLAFTLLAFLGRVLLFGLLFAAAAVVINMMKKK